MPNKTISRRGIIQLMGVTAGAAVLEKAEAGIPAPKNKENPAFTFCLNMATIRGHKLGFVKELETASAAGFRSVEIWIDSFNEYLTKGGSIA
jgi:2-keto-myo-inositol isomerase